MQTCNCQMSSWSYIAMEDRGSSVSHIVTLSAKLDPPEPPTFFLLLPLVYIKHKRKKGMKYSSRVSRATSTTASWRSRRQQQQQQPGCCTEGPGRHVHFSLFPLLLVLSLPSCPGKPGRPIRPKFNFGCRDENENGNINLIIDVLTGVCILAAEMKTKTKTET